MNEFTICGHGEHARFNSVKNGNVIEFQMVGAKETIVSAKMPDGSEKTYTLPNSYIEAAISDGRLVAHVAKKWLIQREEDKAYYTKGHRWSKNIKMAGHFPTEDIDSMLAVMKDRKYDAHKIAV